MIEKADLWLLRHGAAVDPDAEHSDAEDYARPLTKDGVAQSLAAGKVLHKLAKVDKVYTSPRVRTVQSAALAVGHTKFKRDKALDHGKPGAALEHAKDGRVTLVVGHHVLSDGIRKATGKAVELPIGGLAKLEVRDGQWKLAQLLGPDDIAKLA
jgi:phosphohistidine phosphatase SixA